MSLRHRITVSASNPQDLVKAGQQVVSGAKNLKNLKNLKDLATLSAGIGTQVANIGFGAIATETALSAGRFASGIVDELEQAKKQRHTTYKTLEAPRPAGEPVQHTSHATIRYTPTITATSWGKKRDEANGSSGTAPLISQPAQTAPQIPLINAGARVPTIWHTPHNSVYNYREWEKTTDLAANTALGN